MPFRRHSRDRFRPGPNGPGHHERGYGNPWFSVQAGACTEIISFPYTPSDRDTPSSKFGLNHPQIAHVRKSVLIGTYEHRVSLPRPLAKTADRRLSPSQSPRRSLPPPSLSGPGARDGRVRTKLKCAMSGGNKQVQIHSTSTRTLRARVGKLAR